MITRRQALIGVSCLAVAGAVAPFAFTHASAPTPARDEADRSLTLRLADGFRRQTWTYVGQTWDEHRDVIALHENEVLRLTLVNDTHDAVELPAAGPFSGASLRAGETRSVLLHVNELAPFELQSISHGEGLVKACARNLRRFEVRAGHGARTAV
jgi:hypothetical protein